MAAFYSRLRLTVTFSFVFIILCCRCIFSIGVSNGILPLLTYNYASDNNDRRHRVFRLGGVSVAFSLLCVLLGSHAD